uniref:Integrase catalytic domain-containing protein n=1 Tax=Tanacetum cinerariifolium TaxID=118510 RepID=A0A6L2NQ38_TANCI|nr:hypothetical protein [Tanacetum cinerariifolium]
MYNGGHTSFVPHSTIILLLTYPKKKAYRWNYDILDIVQRVVRKLTDYADTMFFNVRYDPNNQRICFQDGIMERTKGVGLVVSSLATKTWSAVAYLVLERIKAKAHDDEEICSSQSRNSNQDDVNDAMKSKKNAVVTASNPLALVAEKTKVSKRKEQVIVSLESEGSDDELKKITALLAKAFNRKKKDIFKDRKKAKVKDYEYYKTKMLLAKKDKDKQVLIVEDHAWMESSSDSDQEINANMVFMAQIEKVLLDSEASSSSSDVKIYETKALQEQLKFKHVVIDNHVECQAKYAKLEAERYEYMIRFSAYFDNDKQHRKQIANQEILFDKMSRQLVELDENMRMLKNTIFEKDLKISELEECVRNKDLEIKKCLERLNECENKLKKIGQINQIIHMIMPSKDKMYNGRKGIGFENSSYFCKAKDLRPTLYDKRAIVLWYTSRFLIHSDDALEIEKSKRARENKIEFAYDYGSLNASYVNEKINFSDDYFQDIINPDFEKIGSPFQQTTSLKTYVSTVILKKIIIDLEDEVVSLLDKEKENLKIIESLNQKNSNVIASGMFKLNVSQSVSPISLLKTSCDLNIVEKKTKRKRRNRNSSKQHDKQVNKDVLRANNAFVHFSDLDTLSSVRRPKPSGVMWKKKGSSNTIKTNLYSVNHSNLNKNVKRYSCKDLMLCNNSHLRDTCSAHDCNNATNSYRNSYDVDVNDLFVFDDVSLRKSHDSKMPFRKKPSASLNVPFRSKLNKSLPRFMCKWLLELQLLAEPVAKWILRIVQICLWIIDSGCSKHMTGNRTLLTNFVEKFHGTVRFGNNDFAMIAGYGDVVIGSMTIKRVYYVEGLVHNLFSVGQFCDKRLEVAFRKSTCFVRNENGVDLLTDDHSSNLYTIDINEIASNSSSCLPKMKFKKDHLCSECEHGKIHQKHHKSKTAFVSNQPLYLLHMDLCGLMHVESINGKRYVLVVIDDFSRYAWVFFLHSKDEASEVIISFLKKTQVNLQLQVQHVRTDDGMEFKNKTLA